MVRMLDASSPSSLRLKNLMLSAMFIALGFVLPFLTGQIPQVGKILLPMHIPVLLCGLICGAEYGLAVGLVLPLLRSFTLGEPPLYPMALAMAPELATYGFVSGFLFSRARWKCLRSLLRCLIIAMLAGRIVYGLAMVSLLGLGGHGYTWSMFVMGAFVNSVPGIIVQLVLIPAIMLALHRAHLVHFEGAGGGVELGEF